MKANRNKHYLAVVKIRPEKDSGLYEIFLSTVFTLVISSIFHLKEDKISFSEKIYLASKNPWILNHAKKMAYNLHKLLYNF